MTWREWATAYPDAALALVPILVAEVKAMDNDTEVLDHYEWILHEIVGVNSDE